MTPRIRAFLVYTTLAALFLWAAISLVYGLRTGLQKSDDLERRVDEVVLFRQHLDPYSDPDMTYPPSAPPVFTALVPVGSKFIRRLLWIGLNFAALGIFCWLVVRTWGKSWPLVVQLGFVLLVIGSKPARAGVAMGQFHLIPLALVIAAEVLARRQIAAGLLFGLSLIKPTMSLPYLFVLLVRRRYVAVMTALLVQSLLFTFVVVWLSRSPWHLVDEWLKNARSQIAMGTIDLPSLIVGNIPSLARLAFPITGIVLVLCFGFVWRYRNRSRLGLTAVATFTAAVMTYHRHYDLVLLLPTLAYLTDAAFRRRRQVKIWAGILGLMLIPPSNLLGTWLEQIYDVAFAVVCYCILPVLIREVAMEPCEMDD